MLKGEIEIVSAIALNKCTYKQITSSKMALSSPYILSTLNSLVRLGYVAKNKSKGYHLTKKGMQVFANYLPKNGDLKRFAREKVVREHSERAKEAINIIETLGLEYINKL